MDDLIDLMGAANVSVDKIAPIVGHTYSATMKAADAMVYRFARRGPDKDLAGYTRTKYGCVDRLPLELPQIQILYYSYVYYD